MRKLTILPFMMTLLICFKAHSDPYTDLFLGKEVSKLEIAKYFMRVNLKDRESLVVIGSQYENSNAPIAGTGFTIKVNDKKLIITNSHILDGNNKFYIYKGELYPISETNTLSCADNDIAVAEVEEDKDLTFGIYTPYNKSLFTTGLNNSPRSAQSPEYRIDDHSFTNLNNRNLFKNTTSDEILSYVQIGNMYDLSCNFFPSSPEHYPGNALFVPVSQAIKAFTKEPISYYQNHHNKIGTLFSMLQLVRHGNCVVYLDSEEMSHEKSRQSILSRSIITPASIVPGMSGSPLLQSNDLRQDRYLISGIATSYDRLMQRSIFTSHSKIKSCIDNFIAGKRGHNKTTKFKYSRDFQSTYKVRENQHETIKEIPHLHGKANKTLTNTRIQEIYNEYLKKNKNTTLTYNDEDYFDNTLNKDTLALIKSLKKTSQINSDDTQQRGGNGYGNGGGPIGDISFNEQINIPIGISINDKLVVALKCDIDGKSEYIFANWEALSLRDRYECQQITINSKISLSKLLSKRTQSRSTKTSSTSEKDFKISSKYKIKKDTIYLTIKGRYAKGKKKFKKVIKIDNNLSQFQPRVEISLDDNYSIIADIKELFFTDMLNISISKRDQKLRDALDQNQIKAYYSLKEKKSNKGSIPLVNSWR